MNWLATTATVSPFIGLFGTVFGIIRASEPSVRLELKPSRGGARHR